MSKLLEITYASNAKNNVLVSTLEIQHVDQQSLYFVKGYQDYQAKDEDGKQVLFAASQIDINLPSKNTRGKQDLQFIIDAVSQEVILYIQAIKDSQKPVYLIIREYIERLPDSPISAPIKTRAKSVRINAFQAVITATFGDLLNTPWPLKRYTPDFTPGLQYV